MWVALKRGPMATRWRFAGKIASGLVWASPSGMKYLQATDGRWFKWAARTEAKG